MSLEPRPPTDLRRLRRQHERRLVLAVVLTFLIVGSIVIGLVYGWPAVFSGWLCLLPGALIFVVLWLLLEGLDYLSKRL